MEKEVFYLTKGKLKELRAEYERLVATEHHKAIEEEAPKMLESEDMNPEFASFQDEMGALRGRIDELKNILDNHQIIKNPPKERQVMVSVGANVTLEAGGKHDKFMIVGTLESDPDLGRISNESPMGKALLGKKSGEEVLVSTPARKKYKIKSISYEVS